MKPSSASQPPGPHAQWPASAGGLAAFIDARLRNPGRSVEAKLAGGVLGGLVAITAPCHIVSPLSAVAIGALAGVVHNLAYEALERLRIDDPVGAVPVHLACGVFGTAAVAVFAPASLLEHGRLAQVGVQLLGIGCCVAWAGATAYALFHMLRALVGLRVSPAEERAGLSLGGFVDPEPEGSLDAEALQALLEQES